MKNTVTRIRGRASTEFGKNYPLSDHVSLIYFGLDESSLIGDVSIRDMKSMKITRINKNRRPSKILTVLYFNIKRTYATGQNCQTDADNGIRPLSNYPDHSVTECPSTIRGCCQ